MQHSGLEARATTATLRVATFNVRHCTLAGRMPRPVDVEATAAAIRSLDADVVAVCELDRRRARSGGIDQPATLADCCGMHVAFAPALVVDGDGDYGVALLSRTPISDVEIVALPACDGAEPRVVLLAATSGWNVAVTHLSTQPERSGPQLAAVVRAARSRSVPYVVAGDLNRTPDRLEAASAAGLTPVLGVRTSPRAFPLRQIDHLLCGPGVTATDVTAPRTPVSDHRPLVATLHHLG